MDGTPELVVRRMAGAIGAEISGIDSAGSFDKAIVVWLRGIWLEHGVVFFRGQDFSPRHWNTPSSRACRSRCK